MLDALSHLVPESLRGTSGKVFYSGRAAFAKSSRLYVLGLNPGGVPESHMSETVGSHTDWVLHNAPVDWSAYRDESWKGKSPGTAGLQPRMLHLFKTLNLNPGAVPCSNLIFMRSSRESELKSADKLKELCWPFHQHVVDTLGIRTILCLGKSVGAWVHMKLGGSSLLDRFVEANERRWTSLTYASMRGIEIITATHPSIADWTKPSTDISQLVRRSLRRAPSWSERP